MMNNELSNKHYTVLLCTIISIAVTLALAIGIHYAEGGTVTLLSPKDAQPKYHWRHPKSEQHDSMAYQQMETIERQQDKEKAAAELLAEHIALYHADTGECKQSEEP